MSKAEELAQWIERRTHDRHAAAHLRALDASHQRLKEALEAAYEHLEYCNYGDSWERECARGDGLPKKLEDALEQAKDLS